MYFRLAVGWLARPGCTWLLLPLVGGLLKPSRLMMCVSASKLDTPWWFLRWNKQLLYLLKLVTLVFEGWMTLFLVLIIIIDVSQRLLSTTGVCCCLLHRWLAKKESLTFSLISCTFFRSYFVPISFWFRSYLVPISFLSRSYHCSFYLNWCPLKPFMFY